jgi:hypothetical protein
VKDTNRDTKGNELLVKNTNNGVPEKELFGEEHQQRRLK